MRVISESLKKAKQTVMSETCAVIATHGYDHDIKQGTDTIELYLGIGDKGRMYVDMTPDEAQLVIDALTAKLASFVPMPK